MNERFKELAQEARLLTGWPVGEVEYQKFAELIVRNNIQTLRSNGYDDAAQCLKDIHFGMDYPI